jgi:prepilin-type N-terminal cleavage/methylation domain-containing protein
MMKKPLEHSCYSTEKGFTLLEVMVSLILGALILGGLMGLISVSLQYSQRLKVKSQVQPLLESVAQEILANPVKAVTGSLNITSAPDAPRVNILYAREELPDLKGMVGHPAELYRVLLECRGQVLEFSLYVTPTDTEKTDELSG